MITEKTTLPLLTTIRRIDYLFDQSDPHVRAPRPKARAPQPAAPQTPNPAPATTESTADDDELTAEEFLEALLQLQQEYKSPAERAVYEAMLKERLKQQEQAKQAAVQRLFAQAMQEYAVELEKKRRQQQERQQYLALLQTVQAMQAWGFN
jgi:hypothetical protein